MKLSELRTWNGGTLPVYVDGGYPVIYFTKAGETICAGCANKTDTSDPVKVADIYYEGRTETCADCGADIESAYGDPDAKYEHTDAADCGCDDCRHESGG